MSHLHEFTRQLINAGVPLENAEPVAQILAREADSGVVNRSSAEQDQVQQALSQTLELDACTDASLNHLEA